MSPIFHDVHHIFSIIPGGHLSEVQPGSRLHWNTVKSLRFGPKIIHLFYRTSQCRRAFLLQWVLSRTPVVVWWLVWSQQCATELWERGRSPGWSLLLRGTAWDGHTDGRSWCISSTKRGQWALWFHRHWPLWTIIYINREFIKNKESVVILFFFN